MLIINLLKYIRNRKIEIENRIAEEEITGNGYKQNCEKAKLTELNNIVEFLEKNNE